MTSNEPACYMYTYINSTLSLLESQLTQLEQEIAERKLDTGSYYSILAVHRAGSLWVGYWLARCFLFFVFNKTCAYFRIDCVYISLCSLNS